MQLSPCRTVRGNASEVSEAALRSLAWTCCLTAKVDEGDLECGGGRARRHMVGGGRCHVLIREAVVWCDEAGGSILSSNGAVLARRVRREITGLGLG